MFSWKRRQSIICLQKSESNFELILGDDSEMSEPGDKIISPLSAVNDEKPFPLGISWMPKSTSGSASSQYFFFAIIAAFTIKIYENVPPCHVFGDGRPLFSFDESHWQNKLREIILTQIGCN